MIFKKKSNEVFKKYLVKNNSDYPFQWSLGSSNSNIILENMNLNIRMKRYLVKKSNGEILYDGLGIEESIKNAVVMIINQNGDIGLIYEWRPIPAKWFWACVRGFGDLNDEDNILTAKREMIEEIGDCIIVDSQRIGVMYQNTTYFEKPVGLILIKVLREDFQNKELNHEEGIYDLKFFSKEEILKMIKGGKIEDTFTLSAIMKYFSIDA